MGTTEIMKLIEARLDILEQKRTVRMTVIKSKTYDPTKAKTDRFVNPYLRILK